MLDSNRGQDLGLDREPNLDLDREPDFDLDSDLDLDSDREMDAETFEAMELYQTFRFDGQEYALFTPVDRNSDNPGEFMAVRRHPDGTFTYTDLVETAELEQVRDYWDSMMDDDTSS